jgi:hypothetical protein
VYEHIAGPNCSEHEHAYCGNRVTSKEMRGCNTLQCLIPKSTGWVSEPDDQDFEKQSNYFLSGISDHMPSGDWSLPEFVPARHGIGIPDPQMDLWGVNNPGQVI